MTTANATNDQNVPNAPNASNVLRKTPLNSRHHASKARMVPFAGWEMPVEYAGITSEHMAVRTRAGVAPHRRRSARRTPQVARPALMPQARRWL